MRTALKTDIGRIRQVNEDRSLIQTDLNGFLLAIVADGMGGHQAGDTASQMAVDIIQQEMHKVHSGMPVDECMQAIRSAVEEANARIYRFASERESHYGMGTTVVAALASQDLVLIGHIGDSRAYKADTHSLTQLTEDHTLVNELVRSGQITAEEAEHHPRRNVLTRALGTEPFVEVDVSSHPWAKGEMLLICSDGLTSLVDSDIILHTLHDETDLDTKVERLVESALRAGGDDNITVVLLVNDSEGQEEMR